MGVLELVILSTALAMDAFAISIAKGLSLGQIRLKHMMIAGLWFGGFQALMPLIGYLGGSFFADLITTYSHWIAFILLMIIGGNMVKESLGEEEKLDDSMDCKAMLLLAIATSIDALAVGVTFAVLKTDIVEAIAFIGIITFVFSAIGVKIGSIFGAKYSSKAGFCGGLVLIIIGLKILLEGLKII